MFQTKEQLNLREKIKNNEIEANHLPNKQFKTIVINMLTELRKGIKEHSQDFNKN